MAGGADTSKDPLDELYAAPPGEFTRRRDRLVKDVRGRGDREAAKQVAALKRPSLPAWAINQLARREPSAIAELVETQHSLAHVTQASELQELSRRRRRTIARLAERARSLLTEAGHPASSGTVDRITSTLLAVNGKDDEKRLLAGRLERDLTGGGFHEVFGEMPQLEEEPQPPVRKRDEERVEALEAEARAALQEAARLRTEADRLRHEADEAAALAAGAQRRAEQAEEKASAARAKL